jgi:hypothetical protein
MVEDHHPSARTNATLRACDRHVARKKMSPAQDQHPAQDHIEPVIDLAALLDLRRPQIYPVRVIGQAARTRHPAQLRPGRQRRR